MAEALETGESLDPWQTREIHFPGSAVPLASACYVRVDMQPGQRIFGPAAVKEAQTTTVVPPASMPDSTTPAI